MTFSPSTKTPMKLEDHQIKYPPFYGLGYRGDRYPAQVGVRPGEQGRVA